MAVMACNIKTLLERLRESVGRSGLETDGDARVQLANLSELELLLERGDMEAVKESSHDIMTVMIKLLARSCSHPVRTYHSCTPTCLRAGEVDF
jgi:hypothetical protein